MRILGSLLVIFMGILGNCFWKCFEISHFNSETKKRKMKKLNTLLNIIIGSFVGVFFGHGIYVIWNYETRPELYAMQSAPWYTSILAYGAATLIIVFIAFIIKVIIKKKSK